MSLGFKIISVLAALTALLVATLGAYQIALSRAQFDSQIEVSRQIVLAALSEQAASKPADAADIAPAMAMIADKLPEFLVRDRGDAIVYRSPERDIVASAPVWFTQLIWPSQEAATMPLADGNVYFHRGFQRAATQQWERFKRFLGILIVVSLIGLLIASWWVVRALTPLAQAIESLQKVVGGDSAKRVADLAGRQPQAIVSACNQVLDERAENDVIRNDLDDSIRVLAQQREQVSDLSQQIEHERADLAQELDEQLSEHVTAIKSMGVSISRRVNEHDPAISQAATLVVESADRIRRSIRSMLARLRPLQVGRKGLAQALSDLIDDWRDHDTDKKFVLRIGPGLDDVPAEIATAAARIGQDCIGNAVRLGGANTVELNFRLLQDALVLQSADDGHGLVDGHDSALSDALKRTRERARAIDGKLEIGKSRQGGLLVRVHLPLVQTSAKTVDNEPISAIK